MKQIIISKLQGNVKKGKINAVYSVCIFKKKCIHILQIMTIYHEGQSFAESELGPWRDIKEIDLYSWWRVKCAKYYFLLMICLYGFPNIDFRFRTW